MNNKKMVGKKPVVIFILTGLFLILLVWLVIAVALDGDEVIVVAPVSGSNISGSVTFNANFTNATDITDPQNASFYYNLSGDWTFIANTTPAGGCSDGLNCSVVVDTTALTDGIYSINVTMDNGTDQVTALGYNNFTNEIMIDNTPPIVFPANISNPITGANYSGNNILLNVSIADALIGTDTVFFNVTNITGDQAWSNQSFTATQEGTSGNYVTYLNTTAFEDETYNITVWANDSLGNLNNSALLDNLKFDNTVPEILPANITSPTDSTNYSGTILLNVSVIDVTSSIDTVYFNITNSSGDQNATFTAGKDNAIFFNATLNTSHFPDGLYNITVFANDTAGNNNNTAVVFEIEMDSTPPIVFNANISSPTAGSNHTSVTLVLNVSVDDVTRNIDTVYFNITNSSGDQNASITATREGTTASYSTTINTTHFPDDKYNITIFANDTLNNLNNSAISEITIDITQPTIDLVCTPNPVTAGDTLTCVCNEGDSTSGVKSAIYTANPSTASTGQGTTSCTVTDHAGNTNSESFTFSVVGAVGGGTSGGGGSSSSTWKTYQVSKTKFEEGHTRELRENQRLRVSLEGEDHFVGVKDISGQSATIEVSSTPQTAILNVGETKKFEVTDDNFYDISVTLDSIANTRAEITIKSIREAIPEPEPIPEPQQAPEPTPEPQLVPETESKGLGIGTIITILIVLVLAGAAIWFFLKKKQPL